MDNTLSPYLYVLLRQYHSPLGGTTQRHRNATFSFISKMREMGFVVLIEEAANNLIFSTVDFVELWTQ